jgi:Spy/CpxP family protein refolding chaperone
MTAIQGAPTLAFHLQPNSAEACESTQLNLKERSMTSRTPTFKRIVLAGLLCASAGLSLAQPAPAAGPGGSGPRAEAMGRHDPAKMQARMDQRLAAFKAKLQITAAQEAAWTTFTAAVKPKPHAGMANMAATHAELDKLPTPERLDRMRALHTQHMTEMNLRMDQRADATKTFYAVLTPAQQKVFDAQFSRTAGRHGGDSKEYMGPMGGKGHMSHMGGQ